MNANRALIIGNLPVPDRWDFGGAPYCLESLILPPEPERDVQSDTSSLASSIAFGQACRRLALVGEMRERLNTELGAVRPRDGLFWFRWITGHQVSFILWQLIARSLAEGMHRGETHTALQETIQYVRGYSNMLLYTSSCSREV